MTHALATVLQRAKQSGFVTNFSVVRVVQGEEPGFNCASFLVTQKTSDERPDPDLPRLMGIDSVIITGDTEDRRNETAFKVPVLEAAGRRLVEPTRNPGAIQTGQAKRFLSESGFAVFYAATTDKNYDPKTDLDEKQVAVAVSGIANAYRLALLAGSKRLLLPAGILFSAGGVVSPFDEARMAMMGILAGWGYPCEAPEVVVLARHGMDQSAYAYVFESIKDGNKNILLEPVTSTGYSAENICDNLRCFAGDDNVDEGLIGMAIRGMENEK